MMSKDSTKRQMEIREHDKIKTAKEFDIDRIDRGKYLLKRKSKRRNEGLVDWLLSCPDKDFFVPIESESTNA